MDKLLNWLALRWAGEARPGDGAHLPGFGQMQLLGLADSHQPIVLQTLSWRASKGFTFGQLLVCPPLGTEVFVR